MHSSLSSLSCPTGPFFSLKPHPPPPSHPPTYPPPRLPCALGLVSATGRMSPFRPPAPCLGHLQSPPSQMQRLGLPAYSSMSELGEKALVSPLCCSWGPPGYGMPQVPSAVLSSPYLTCRAQSPAEEPHLQPGRRSETSQCPCLFLLGVSVEQEGRSHDPSA